MNALSDGSRSAVLKGYKYSWLSLGVLALPSSIKSSVKGFLTVKLPLQGSTKIFLSLKMEGRSFKRKVRTIPGNHKISCICTSKNKLPHGNEWDGEVGLDRLEAFILIVNSIPEASIM